MALKLARRLLIVTAAVFVLVTPSAVYTCGPFFEAADFIPRSRPQASLPDFAAGDLGIVLPGLRQPYLIVAYRYLNNLKLNKEQQQDAIDVWNRNVGPNPESQDNNAIGTWRVAREKVSGLPPEPKYAAYAPVSPDQPYETFLNCPDEAYKTAASTLQDRINRYTATSNAVREWITAQDEVFANCDGKAQVIPAALDSSDSLLLTDRAYQIAAAQFYARKFDEAIASFDALAKEGSSPWSWISPYLAARAQIRKANLASPDYGKFDTSMMKAAQQRLEQVINDPKSAPMHEPALRLLDYVRFRTEPDKRLTELGQLMLKPDPGLSFRQHLWDYVHLVAQGEQADDLSDWVRTFPSVSNRYRPMGTSQMTDPESAKHAISKWHEKYSLPWLVAALEVGDASASQTEELLKAAGQVPASSPGYLSVRYFALKLMAGRNQQDAVRKELDTLLGNPAPIDLSAGSRNLLNDERQKLATSLPDFLAHAAEMPSSVGIDEDGDGEIDSDDSGKPNPAAQKAYFNSYAAQILNRHLPLALLVESAQSSALPSHLRREIARGAWLRAVLIGDLATAEKLQPALQELDRPLWTTMDPFRAAHSEVEKHFAAIFITLQNPGLLPSVKEGLLRTATLGEIDNYRDNWWCDGRGTRTENTGQNQKPDFPFPAYIAENDRKRTQQELEKLATIDFAPNYLTSEVLAFAKQHLEDPRIPQALHLAVRSTRFGCTNPDTTHLSEAAFKLLHERYPKSEWAEKTKYHY